MHDPLQKIATRNNVLVEVVRFKADVGVHDTADKYNVDTVSYGVGCNVIMID